MESNNNGKGIFYGVIGVATLIVAIIGATFAYFTAQTTSSEYIQGAAATAGLDVNVVRMTGASASETEGSEQYIMVPQLDTTLDDAIVGTNGQPCIDAGGSLVCSIYRIVVHNNGSAPITVSGTLDFYTSTTADGKQGEATASGDVTTAPAATTNNLMNHLKWARLTQPTGVTDKSYTYDDVKSADSALDANTPTTLLAYTNTELATGKNGYQLTTDGTLFSYANTTQTLTTDGTQSQIAVNQYLYAIEVSGTSTTPVGGTADDAVANIDLLNGYTVSGAHGRYTDLIDPTDDLAVAWNVVNDADAGTVTKTATVSAGANKPGSWYLEANGTAGDTKVFYIVVWISENDQEQNKVDHGHFTGTVTFNSSAGSGATSTFTESV